jgi:FkbM family methyltransferase
MSDLIFDVGAHKGEDTALYLAKGFRVVAVEAHPDLAEGIRQRFSGAIHAGHLVVVQAAISDSVGSVPFYVNDKVSVWGTTFESWAQRNAKMGAPSRCIEVPSIRFDELLDEHGTPYYLKVDIEGADLLCLEALRDRATPRHVSIESTKSSWDELLAEFDLLESLGYSHFKVVSQHNVQKQRAPRPALEGDYVPYRPMPGSSGFFGEEAPGRWLSAKEALDAYLPAYITYALYGDDGLVYRYPEMRQELERYVNCPTESVWFDTHATRKPLT